MAKNAAPNVVSCPSHKSTGQGAVPPSRTVDKGLPRAELIPINAEAGARASTAAMVPFVFRCPQTGLNVQHTWPDEDKPFDEKTYVFVACSSCTRMHLIDRSTGKTKTPNNSRTHRHPRRARGLSWNAARLFAGLRYNGATSWLSVPLRTHRLSP
jgi:hypothetical protein